MFTFQFVVADGDAVQTMEKGLSQLNQAAFGFVTKLMGGAVTGTIAMGLYLAGLFLILEFVGLFQRANEREGRVSGLDIAQILLTFVIACGVIAASLVIFQFISSIVDGIIGMVAKVGISQLGPTSNPVKFPSFNLLNPAPFFEAIPPWLIGFLVAFAAGIVINVVLIIRTIEVYIMLALSPIPLATFVSKEHRSIGVSFIKTFAAYMLQSVVLLLITNLYVTITSTASSSGDVNVALGAMVAYIVTIIASLRISKSILGVGI